jgi:hypothetical protein
VTIHFQPLAINYSLAVHPRLPIIAVSSHEAGNAALMKAGASTVCGKMEFQRIEEVIQQLVS